MAWVCSYMYIQKSIIAMHYMWKSDLVSMRWLKIQIFFCCVVKRSYLVNFISRISIIFFPWKVQMHLIHLNLHLLLEILLQLLPRSQEWRHPATITLPRTSLVDYQIRTRTDTKSISSWRNSFKTMSILCLRSIQNDVKWFISLFQGAQTK